jgi:hypothetical protein
MKNVSAGKVTSGRNGTPSVGISGPKSGTPNMPRVGGHATNNGNGKQGVGGGAYSKS